MEENKMRDLNLDEMDKVSGGSGGKTDNKDDIRYWMKDRGCPLCGKSRTLNFFLLSHDDHCAHIHCSSCRGDFTVFV